MILLSSPNSRFPRLVDIAGDGKGDMTVRDALRLKEPPIALTSAAGFDGRAQRPTDQPKDAA